MVQKKYRDIKIGEIWYHPNYLTNPFIKDLPDTIVKITNVKRDLYCKLWIQYQEFNLELWKPINDSKIECPAYEFIYDKGFKKKKLTNIKK